MTIVYFDGTRLVQHTDGTRIWTDNARKGFRIEAPRFLPCHPPTPYPQG